jgi:surface polysaccharide O-acyltransferase-like enzyme
MDKVDLEFVLGYSGYYVAGYYLRQYGLSPARRRLVYALGLVSLLFTIFSSRLLSLQSGAANSSFYAYLLPTTFFVAVAVFCLFQYGFSQISMPRKASGALLTLSRLSFGMYLVHDLFNILFVQIGFTSLSYCAVFSVPINALLIFFLSAMLTLLLQKIPVLRRYIL